MIYCKGNRVIEVSRVACAGKRPSMFIGQGNKVEKVASFSSDESAKKFCDILDEFLGIQDQEVKK